MAIDNDRVDTLEIDTTDTEDSTIEAWFATSAEKVSSRPKLMCPAISNNTARIIFEYYGAV